MIGIIYTDKEQMLIDLQRTNQLNDFTLTLQGEPRHFERNPNEIPYTYHIEHPEGDKWAIICDDEGRVENLIREGVALGTDWFDMNIVHAT